MGVGLFVICCFSLAVLKFSLNFCHYNFNVSLCVPLWGSPVRESLHFLELGDCFLSQVREIFTYYVFKYVLRPLPSLYSLWDHCKVNINMFDVVPEISLTVLISFHSFFFFTAVISTTLSSISLICSSVPFSPLPIPSSVSFIACTVFFISLWLFLCFLTFC